MAWQVKYYWKYRDLNDAEHTVNILEYTGDVLTPVLCIAGDLAFETVYADIPHKFYPVRGSLGRFSLLSETNGQYTGLYTADAKKYKVNHYKGAVLIGTFYLDSEFYSEPFSDLDNYFVNFSANDGFNLLDRITYLEDDGDSYGGIVTQWTVIGNILSKLALDWGALYVGLSTTIDGVTLAAGETIFHKHHILHDNYYNEDGEPETCRRVLEGILEPLGAYIEHRNGNLYITDPSYIDSDVAVPFKKFNPSTFQYVSTENINPKIGDLTTIGFASAESQKNIQAGFNKQVVVYSPYRDINFLDFEAKETIFADELATTGYGSGDYQWQETLYDTSFTWNKSGQGKFARATATSGSKIGEKSYYLKLGKYTFGQSANEASLSYSLKKQLPYIIPSAGYFLRLDISAYFRTKVKYEDPNESGVALKYGSLFLKVKIGNKQFVRVNPGGVVNVYPGEWRDENFSTNDWYRLDFYKVVDYHTTLQNTVYEYGAINDQYVTATMQKIYADRSIVTTPMMIPLGSGFSGGILDVQVFGFESGASEQFGADQPAYNATYDCRINKFELSICDASGKKVVNNDLEYEKALDPKYKNKRDDIALIHGTNTMGIPFERGGILGHNGTQYYYMQSWTREGFTSILEKMLLRSVLSNYKNPSVVITCSLNLMSSLFGYVTYANYLPGKKLMITACTVNHADATADVTLTEFNKDNLPLNL